MTNLKTTKRALFSSVIALLLCFAMLLGTTFAWFTDSATSANNIIKTGNLDVEMYWADGTKAVPADESADWIDATAGAIFDYDNWEPGYVQVRHIKIANEGSLALKYKVNIIANGEVSDLANVIDVYYVDPAVQVADRDALKSEYRLGTLTDVLAALGDTGNGMLKAYTADTITIAFKMQEDAGNEYMNKSIGTDFTVQLLATQLASESDSFDNQYDANAKYPAVDIVTVPENNTEDVVLSTETVKVTVPSTAAQAGDDYKIAVSNETTETDATTGETTVAFDLTMYKNNEKVSGTTVYAITKNVGAGLFISEVTHNGVALEKATTGADQTWTYDAATGELTIYTASFSPFAVAYTEYKDYTMKLNRGHNKNSEISVSTGSDLLPIVAVNPSIAGYTVYEGDTRIANAVTFRFSNVTEQTIDENSYKVSFDLAVLDENGNELTIKEGKFNPYINTDLREYLWVYVNLIEGIPAGYSVSEVKVNDTVLTAATGGYAPTNGYLILSDGVSLQVTEAGTFEITLTK